MYQTTALDHAPCMTHSASMTASVAPYIPKPPPSPKTRPKRSSSLAQLYAIQKVLYDTSQNGECAKPTDLAQVARAWSDLESLKLRIKMKPAPKPIDTTKLPAKTPTKPAPSFSESGVS